MDRLLSRKPVMEATQTNWREAPFKITS